MTIKFIVVHCLDTPNDRPTGIDEVHRWHIRRGWDGVGYNRLIRRSGRIEHGRPWYWPGAHVQDFNGDGEGHNFDSLGIALEGRDQYTAAQYRSLENMVRYFLLKWPGAEVVGHCDLDPRKTCPNVNIRAWWAERVHAHNNQRGH